MATDLDALLTMMQDMVGDYDSTSEALFTRFTNIAYRDVWSAYEWPERFGSTFVVTAAPYTTGTVSITQGTDALTGVGTVFPSTAASTPWRFGKSYSDPWYVVSARGSDTTLTLDEDYTEATLAAAGYVLYADTFSLPSEAEAVRYTLIHRSGYTNPAPVTKRSMDHFAALPTTIGVPSAWCMSDKDSSGDLTIQVSPVPDDIYRLHVHYEKKVTELSSGTDEPLLDERRRDLIFERAMWHVYRFRNDSSSAADQLVLYQRRLNEAISKERQSSTSPPFRTFDSEVGDPLINYTFPAQEGS